MRRSAEKHVRPHCFFPALHILIGFLSESRALRESLRAIASHSADGFLMVREKLKVVTPFSLVTLIFSLCCSKMVLTI